MPALYDLPGFEAQIVDQDYLADLGVTVRPLPETLNKLTSGSRDFQERYRARTLTLPPVVEDSDITLDQALPVHDYTGKCPRDTFELNPGTGCPLSCLYCLVTDGRHTQRAVRYENYHLYLRQVLDRSEGRRAFYYFSPKTEAFSELTLRTGLAHRILGEFREHFRSHPRSGARLFLATKAGCSQLLASDGGETILDLLADLAGKVQFNTSIGILPPGVMEVLEPDAPMMADRLAAMRLCQERGIYARAVLSQPILAPYLTDEVMHRYFEALQAHGIVNFKPEFLTVCPENLAGIAQLVGHFDRDLERRLYAIYLDPANGDHRKQRERTAPDRALCRRLLEQLMAIGASYGMTLSVCHWVRDQLGISGAAIPIVNDQGFRCLGYQTRFLAQVGP